VNNWIADIKLKELGRKEIDIAEIEMPGLMALRAKYGHDKRFQGPGLPAVFI
jgi:adenosylhomocysteinase